MDLAIQQILILECEDDGYYGFLGTQKRGRKTKCRHALKHFSRYLKKHFGEISFLDVTDEVFLSYTSSQNRDEEDLEILVDFFVYISKMQHF